MVTELSPESIYDAVSAALLAATELHDVDALLNQTTTPSPVKHRAFRLNPGQADPQPGKARPGDVLGLIERVQVIVTHDLDPNANLASYRLASQDFLQVVRTILTRTEVSGLAQPLFRGRSIRTVGHTIEQVVNFDLYYHVSLPAAV